MGLFCPGWSGQKNPLIWLAKQRERILRLHPAIFIYPMFSKNFIKEMYKIRPARAAFFERLKKSTAQMVAFLRENGALDGAHSTGEATKNWTVIFRAFTLDALQVMRLTPYVTLYRKILCEKNNSTKKNNFIEKSATCYSMYVWVGWTLRYMF